MNKPMGTIEPKAKLCSKCGIKFLTNPISLRYHEHDNKTFTGRNIGWNRKYKAQQDVDVLTIRSIPSGKEMQIILSKDDYDEMFTKHKIHRRKVLGVTS